MEMDKPLDRLSMDEVMDWLMDLGFSEEVQHAFQGEECLTYTVVRYIHVCTTIS